MKGLFRGLLVLGVLAGIVMAVRSYLESTTTAEPQTVQMFFENGSTVSLPKSSVTAQEFGDIAHKVLEVAGHSSMLEHS